MAAAMSQSNNGSLSSSNSNQNLNQSNTAEIQAQFEMLVELRRFMNIDLFQRGYYQIRVQIKCMNKQVPIKIMLQLEKNQNNMNLSDSMYPSCVVDDYAVSKTFLILYRNEEIILDDQILFKVSTLVNAFNLVESFEKMDLQLNIELWFTENDFKPTPTTSVSDDPSVINKDSQAANNASSLSIASSSSSTGAGVVQFTNLNNLNGGSNASTSSLNNGSTSNVNAVANNGMQLLCSRSFKIHFDPRQGIHLQIPVLFDYFHLSAVLCTIHCTLLTLLPPVMLGTSFQRNSTLATILFGKDLSKFKNQSDIGDATMKRAVYLHNQICGLLLASYENLQDHILKMSTHLDEYKLKKLDMDYIDCQEKLHKISEFAQECSDAETLDDLANRHVAQCSAENIMQWCTYFDNFSLSQEIAPQLASDYHNKRLKRFSESFFVKDLPKKNLYEYELNDNYVNLNDMIRQSVYYSLLPSLSVSCNDLDGVPDSIPIIFEDNYVSNFSPPSSNSSNFSSNESITKRDKKSLDKNPFLRSLNSSIKSNSTTNKQMVNKEQNRKSSISSNETSANSLQLSNGSRQLHRKLRKKISSYGDSTDHTEENKSIQLVSYRKVNTEEVEISNNNVFVNSNSEESIGSNVSETPSSTTQSKLNLIKAELSSRGSTPVMNRTKNLDSITESLANGGYLTDGKKRNLYKQQTHEVFLKTEDISENSSSKHNQCKSLTNLTSSNNEFEAKFTENKNVDTSINKEGIDQDEIGISLDDNEVSLNETTNEAEISLTETFLVGLKNKALTNLISGEMNGQESGPVDFSFKSRALYESFRGKPSTLERPRQKRTMNSSVSSTPVATDKICKRISYDNVLEGVKSSNGDREEDKFKKEDLPNKKKEKLSRQLTIHTDKNSLSSVLNENVYKFALAKEELKKLLHPKYPGNIYSEYSSLFCTGPYFYAELTPKLKIFPSFERSAKNGHRSSLMSTLSSKTKMMKLFKSMQQEDSGLYKKMSRYHRLYSKRIVNLLNLLKTVRDDESFDCLLVTIFDDIEGSLEITIDSQSINSDEMNESLFDDEKLHLVVCVHGLDGNSGDLRLVRTYIELALPGAKIDFLMSELNQDNTFDDLEVMTKQLIKEINDYIEIFAIDPDRISFIGHSLGNLIVRSTVAHDDFKPFVSKLHTYLSLSGPHLGTLYNSSGLINMGMWIMQKWKKSGSLLQLSLKDHSELQKTFLYKLSTKPTFENFKNILLVASPQDRYVPFHSARIEMCKAALKDSMYGAVYREMVTNILKPIKNNPNITFKRYSAFHCLPSGTNNFIGRAAHIAVLDSELFVEKLVLVSVAKYFR